MAITRLLAITALIWAANVGAAQSQQAGPPPAVLVQAAELKPLAARAEFIGRAAAVDKVDLRARVKGFLGPRKFNDGDQVKEGQVLFTIEPDTYQATVDQKTATRDAARAALANSELQFKRAAELLRTNTGTQAVYDQRQSELLQAKASLEEAEAALRDAQINLSYTEIKSPITGRVGKAAFSPGNLVSPDSGVLATVVTESPIRVLFSVTQRELLEARKQSGNGGDALIVQLRLADDSIYPEKGKLDFLDVVVDPKTDGQIVRAVFDNKNGTLTDGQTVRVVLEAEKPPTVVAIPEAAVALDQAGAYVFVVNDKNVVEQKRIKTGTSRDGLLAVEQGLKAGDKVVIQGQQRVRAGMTVAPSDAPAAPSMPTR
ncbi:MAG: efflux RND transporter periplasmic adaptor subunit [Proteobacteria bacterium]|nr:efflux RND transporter periplasmic adaptor subunit [Pseudomonadota bacterium]